MSIDSIKNYLKRRESKEILNVQLFEIIPEEGSQIKYDGNTIIKDYGLTDIANDVRKARDIELFVLIEENLPKGYKFEIGEGFWACKVLKIVKRGCEDEYNVSNNRNKRN